MCWFAAQHQISTCRHQKLDSFDSKFKIELNIYCQSPKATGRGSQIAESKLPLKNVHHTSFGV